MTPTELLAYVIGGSFIGCALAMLLSDIIEMIREEQKIRRERLR